MKSIILAIAIVFTLAISCVSRRPAEYSLQLEFCRQNARSCAEYIECRVKVANDFGREFMGTCEEDAGHE